LSDLLHATEQRLAAATRGFMHCSFARSLLHKGSVRWADDDAGHTAELRGVRSCQAFLRPPRVREWLPEDQPPIFAAVRTMLRSADGRIGGVGLKLHPDYSYGPYHG
jgi:hypothetical protein